MGYLIYKTKDIYYEFYVDDVIKISDIMYAPRFSHFYVILKKQIPMTNSFGFKRINIQVDKDNHKEYDKLISYCKD